MIFNKTFLIIFFVLFYSVNCICQTSSDFVTSAFSKWDSLDYKGAIEDFNKALELDTQTVGIKYLEGNVYYNMAHLKEVVGDYSGAIEDYSRVCELKHSLFVSAYYHRGLLKSKLNDRKEAILDYSKTVEVNDKELYNFKTVKFYYELENLKIVIKEFDIEIKNDSLNDVYYHCRGFYKEGMEDYEGAIKDYSKAIELSPLNAEYYHKRASALMEIDDKINSCLDYRKSIELGYNQSLHIIEEYCK